MNEINIIVLVVLSFLDTLLTYEWAMSCVKWKPSLKLKQVEGNPFVVICWNNFGILGGSVISGGILLIVQYLLGSIHINFYWIIVVILIFANLNHIRNFWVLKNKLKVEVKK